MFLKNLFQRTLFSRISYSSPSPYSIFIAQCSTSSPSPSPPMVSVWWDFENCHVPSRLDGSGVVLVRALRAAIKSVGISDHSFLQINAYGDVFQIGETRQKELCGAGVKFIQVSPDGKGKGKGSADRSLHLGIMTWVLRNPPPAHIFFITGDRDFSPLLHTLRLNNYNILLATKEVVHSVLTSAASVMWHWNALIREEKNLTGKFFNQPPDDFWYGRYEGPIEDPFTIVDRPAYSWDMTGLGRNADDPELLSEDSFWGELQIFLKTDMGCLLIAESRTRGNLAYYLHKYGPSVLKSLSEEVVCRMVDILLYEKLVLESLSGSTSSGDAQYRFRLPSESSSATE